MLWLLLIERKGQKEKKKILTVAYQIDVFLKSSPGHNIDLHLLCHQDLLWQCQACLLSNGKFCKAKWSHYIALINKFAKTLLPPDSLDVMWLARTSAIPLRKQPKRLSKAYLRLC